MVERRVYFGLDRREVYEAFMKNMEKSYKENLPLQEVIKNAYELTRNNILDVVENEVLSQVLGISYD